MRQMDIHDEPDGLPEFEIPGLRNFAAQLVQLAVVCCDVRIFDFPVSACVGSNIWQRSTCHPHCEWIFVVFCGAGVVPVIFPTEQNFILADFSDPLNCFSWLYILVGIN